MPNLFQYGAMCVCVCVCVCVCDRSNCNIKKKGKKAKYILHVIALVTNNTFVLIYIIHVYYSGHCLVDTLSVLMVISLAPVLMV